METNTNQNTEPPISLVKFRQMTGMSDTTIWRLRKTGKLTAFNQNGRLYITREAIAEFNRRLEAGEFSRAPVVPPPPQSKKPKARVVEAESDLPAVAGRMQCSNAEFERRCLICLAEEQEKINPDNVLIDLLCDGARLAREFSAAMQA